MDDRPVLVIGPTGADATLIASIQDPPPRSDLVALTSTRSDAEYLDPASRRDALSAPTRNLLLLGYGMGIPLPRGLGPRAGYQHPRAGDCARCDGSRWATVDGNGRKVPGHRCPVCRGRG